ALAVGAATPDAALERGVHAASTPGNPKALDLRSQVRICKRKRRERRAPMLQKAGRGVDLSRFSKFPLALDQSLINPRRRVWLRRAGFIGCLAGGILRCRALRGGR